MVKSLHPEALQRFLVIVRAALLFTLAATGIFYLVFTWHWPLVGDSSIIHYECFLMDHGLALYRQVPDMNMPGSFLIEWAAMHVFGPGSQGWRLFDLAVLVAAGIAALGICWRYDKLAGLFAAVLFAVLHGRDGLNDTGQRDLTMAALVLIAYAFLFIAWRRRRQWAAFLFGFSMAAAGTIKPTPLPLGLLLIVMMVVYFRRQGTKVRGFVGWAILGFSLPLFTCLIFLARQQAVWAFFHGLVTVVPYFASLGRKPFGYLLVHSVSPLMPLVIVWLLLHMLRISGNRSDQVPDAGWIRSKWERFALLIGAALMLAGFVAQGKGFPYQRYPFLILLLVFMALDFTAMLRQAGVRRLVAMLALAWGAFVIAPMSLVILHRFDWKNQESVTLLMSDLQRIGGPNLSGNVQCIDTISGCAGALYRMRVVQRTGLVSDFLLFGSPRFSAVRSARRQLLAALQTAPPRLIVVTSRLFPSGPDGFQKLKRWPELESELSRDYRLCLTRTPPDPVRWWSRVQQPVSYRIYELRSMGGVGCQAARFQ